jgi:hypothetical protein
VGGANIKIAHYVNHGYLEEEKSMIQAKLFWREKTIICLVHNISF